MTSLTIRACTQADWPAIVGVDQLAFGYTFDEEEGAGELAVFEPDRALLACSGDTPVGLTTAYTLSMSVPGGTAYVPGRAEVACGGISWVGVLPTHRRRGILTALMQRQLDDLHALGEPIAALFASEPAIYGRFGFGLASQRISMSIPSAAVRISGLEDATLSTRLVEVAEARPSIERVYDEARARRAGIPSRNEAWWQRCTFDPKSMREGFSERRCFLVEDADGRPRAYAVYAIKPTWEHGLPNGHLRIREHAALDPAAATALWRLLLSVDLVTKVTHDNVPVDDPVLRLLDNPRKALPVLGDSLYVRLVDLPAALGARTYDLPFDGVVEVRDRLAARNDGRWRLELGSDGATCTRTDSEADVRLDVSELGGAYLGGMSLLSRGFAGAVEERTPGALAALSNAFRHEPAPYCPFVF